MKNRPHAIVEKTKQTTGACNTASFRTIASKRLDPRWRRSQPNLLTPNLELFTAVNPFWRVEVRDKH